MEPLGRKLSHCWAMFLKETFGLELVTALFSFWCPWDEQLPPAHSPPEHVTLTQAPSHLDRPKPLKPSAETRTSSFLGCVGPTTEADRDNLNVFREVIPSAIIGNSFGEGGGGRFDLLVFVLCMECSLNSNMKFKDLVLPSSSVFWFNMLPLSLGIPYLPIRTGLVLCGPHQPP